MPIIPNIGLFDDDLSFAEPAPPFVDGEPADIGGPPAEKPREKRPHKETVYVDSPDDIPEEEQPQRKKMRKQYGTLNIPVSLYDDLKQWRDAFKALEKNKKWTYEAVLGEMINALEMYRPKVAQKYREMVTLAGTKTKRRKSTASVRKASVKKNKKNLGYISFPLPKGYSMRLKIHKGVTKWRDGQKYVLPDYCHLPMNVPTDSNYPFVMPGQNVSADTLLTYPGTYKMTKKERPLRIGVAVVSDKGVTKKYKIHKSRMTGRVFVVKGRKRYSVETIRKLYNNNIKIESDDPELTDRYASEIAFKRPASETESEPRDL